MTEPKLFGIERGALQKNITRLWYGKAGVPPTYCIAAVLFPRLLGIIYLIAFASLWTQIDGLIGERGLLPFTDYLDAVEQHYRQQDPPASPTWNFPTLVWLYPTDESLQLLCGTGVVCAVLLIFGLVPLPALILLWLCYLSLFKAGQAFLSFQWDLLLLETGFLTMFIVPLSLQARVSAAPQPPRVALWLLWFLLFRLMFQSGLVKLIWNDSLVLPDGGQVPNAWESLTALEYHYWTQPLPIWTSWYIAKLPVWFHKLCVVVMFVIELVLPWFIFGPRILRGFACSGITLLMLLIATTGNYTYFNLLTMALATTLLDDQAWPSFIRQWLVREDSNESSSTYRGRITLGIIAVLVLLSLQNSFVRFSQFHLFNGYGLFQRMTETRPEIVIEGSLDGKEWQAYSFRWKPGDLSRRPGLCAPHQPRLDWQMWFEALQFERALKLSGTVSEQHQSSWFRSLLRRLLENEPSVLALLDKAPFPTPPKHVRFTLYQYRFSTADERSKTGRWWERDRVWTSPSLSRTE